ncbi:MAG: radical SAM protein [Candidatus Scalindua sp.]|nr:radical SAM protein [Candidatus Scalindua sp.]
MNILLIQPENLSGLVKDRGFIPVALLYLASALRDHSHKPHILDFSVLDIPKDNASRIAFLENTCNAKIKKFGVKLVGINCFSTMHYPLVDELAKFIKRHNPAVKICIGGAHPSFFGEEILSNSEYIDYIVVGEGEEALIGLADIIEKGDDTLTHEADISNIPAIIYRDKNREILENPRKSYIKDINILKMPAWELIDLTNYYRNKQDYYNPKKQKFHVVVPIMTSRSCPFSCTFCSAHLLMGNSYRKKTAVRVVDEIEYLHLERNQNYFEFIDDVFVIDKQHVLDICEEICKRNLDISFSVGGIYIAMVDKEMIDALTDAGLVTLYLPIEHGNEKIRTSIIKKRLKDEKNFEIVEYVKNKNLFTIGLFIMGFPEETEETLEQTRKFIVELSLDINIVSALVPFPKTAIYEQAKRDDLLMINMDDLWRGKEFYSVSNKNQFFIKPYNASLEILHKYREILNQCIISAKGQKN